MKKAGAQVEMLPFSTKEIEIVTEDGKREKAKFLGSFEEDALIMDKAGEYHLLRGGVPALTLPEDRRR